jgi:hypothetical protein
MFASLIKVRATYGNTNEYFKRRYITIAAGITGGAVSMFGIAFAFVPTEAVSSILIYELKLILSCVGFIIPALAFYYFNSKKTKLTAAAETATKR